MTTAETHARMVTNIARVCHEANRTYSEAMDLDTHLPWSHAPQWQKDSAIQGVQNILDGKVVNPEDSHIAWYDHKLADGWTYGKTKDEVAKTHPCMVPYYELSEAQRAKDTLFVNIVRALIPRESVEKVRAVDETFFDGVYERRKNEFERTFSAPLKPLDPHGLTEPLHLELDADGQPVRAPDPQPYNEPTDEFDTAAAAAQEQNDGEGQATDQVTGQVHQPTQATGDGQEPEGGDKQ